MKCERCGCETEHHICKACYRYEEAKTDMEIFARMETQALAEAMEQTEEEE